MSVLLCEGLGAKEVYDSGVFDRKISVKIGGGYENLLEQSVGATVTHGKLAVKGGTASFGNLIFQAE